MDIPAKISDPKPTKKKNSVARPQNNSRKKLPTHHPIRNIAGTAEAILDKLEIESDADLRELEEVLMRVKIERRPAESVN